MCFFDLRILMDSLKEKQLEEALVKRAVGYEIEEVIEEFSVDENKVQNLVKKKRSTKHFPPDIYYNDFASSYFP